MTQSELSTTTEIFGCVDILTTTGCRKVTMKEVIILTINTNAFTPLNFRTFPAYSETGTILDFKVLVFLLLDIFTTILIVLLSGVTPVVSVAGFSG